jgi:SAM-dependent methyltransferase
VLEAFNPASYIGVDLVHGPGVDVVCPAETLVDEFGPNAFDVVVSTETIEHVRDWRLIVSNIKHVLTPNGLVLLTTRSRGFPRHNYPNDYWRFEPSDMRIIFSDFEIVRIDDDDPESPGVFVAARRPEVFEEVNLNGHALYSMICDRPMVTAEQAEEWKAARSEARDLQAQLAAALARIKDLALRLHVTTRR